MIGETTNIHALERDMIRIERDLMQDPVALKSARLRVIRRAIGEILSTHLRLPDGETGALIMLFEKMIEEKLDIKKEQDGE